MHMWLAALSRSVLTWHSRRLHARDRCTITLPTYKRGRLAAVDKDALLGVPQGVQHVTTQQPLGVCVCVPGDVRPAYYYMQLARWGTSIGLISGHTQLKDHLGGGELTLE